MRRRALLATAAAASTASLAGCSVPPWGEIPETADGAEVTFRTKHTGEFESDEPSPHDDAVLLRALDADPPRLTVRGCLLAGSRDCYRVDLIETTLDADRLLLRLTRLGRREAAVRLRGGTQRGSREGEARRRKHRSE